MNKTDNKKDGNIFLSSISWMQMKYNKNKGDGFYDANYETTEF